MTATSYAHANEDVLLFEALSEVSSQVGFYIDVGANDPEDASITKLFYDRGWRGINIEPSPEWFARLSEVRRRDTNVHAVASNQPGHIEFYDVIGEQLGTVVREYAKHYSDLGKSVRSFPVKVVTLTEICEKYAPEEIHFLKIDVEGHEAEVLEGMDFTRFRPWILVIEATEPNTRIPTHQKWDQRVRNAGYEFVFTDLLNRYYVAEEHPALTTRLSASGHEYMARILAQLEKERNELAARLSRLEDRLTRDGSEVLTQTGAFEIHDEIRNILRPLRPCAVQGYNKARFGSGYDGGYVLIDDFRTVDTAFSFGVEQNASWDVEIAKRGVTVYQFDHTIDAPITDHARLIFAKKKIAAQAGLNQETLAALIEHHDKQKKSPNIILKIDIENDEWMVFDATPSELLSRCSQIVGEFHYLEGLADSDWRQLFARVLKKLSEAYAVVHVHANNHAGFSNIANVVIPNVLEITFANRTLYSFSETDEVFPGPLDEPNNPSRPDMYLGSFRF
jgi:FkbM family methyltransferase